MKDASAPHVGQWRLWDQLCLRGPGFPASGVLRLAPEELSAAAEGFGTEKDLTGPRWEEFEERFGATALSISGMLQEIAGLPMFQAAVAWQNPTVLKSGIGPFLRWTPEGGKRPSMARQREELVAHYWQRFCVKNDTIGFFGPVGWGTWDPSVRGLEVDPGTGLTSGSGVYFSSWAVDAVARRVSEDPAVREWLAPRRMPFVRLSGDEVHTPGLPPVRVGDAERQVLELCDGTHAARAIQGELGFEVSGVLEGLVKRRWIVWRLKVPADTHPERRLRDSLTEIGDPDVRDRALAKLEVLERGRDRIRDAGRDPEALVAAFQALEVDFTELTQTAAQRQKNAGTAPCRSLIYSDSTRAARVRVGDDLLSALAPMDLLLASSTWLTSAMSERISAHARKVFEEQSAGGEREVDLATCWFACIPMLHSDLIADTADLQRQFWERWHSIIRPAPGVRRVRLDGAEIAGQVRELFASPGGGWSTARYACPDMLVLADDADAVRRGEFELVVGELHTAINTLGASLFVNQHASRDELLELVDRDHPRPRMMPLQPKEHRARLSARTRYSLVRDQDYCVALADSSADPHRPRTIASADVSVRDHDGRLVAVLPDGSVFDLVDIFSQALTMQVIDMFRIVPDDAEHFPRVSIDRMVVTRETWRFDPATMEFAGDKSEARRYVRAGQWRRSQGLPRFVFVVSPTEPRPFYVDFDSPVYVNIFAKAVRRLLRDKPEARMTISEMLPTPEQTWLTDDQGNGYTSELRFVAVDETQTRADEARDHLSQNAVVVEETLAPVIRRRCRAPWGRWGAGPAG
ncbi:lantibiotic dehydratase [Actinomadura sp. DC4]|uniref:lantibiotic dehydratase n=1 Tax=Actinomadura sp. DC4 TaxID=3055069 RepID=UPI0025AF6E3D|nr:lantibiotic dehydratase [Actinomadura sp. DC4]MDN3356428.1 lantibiotic dehydratase [Actinomadura sp. DC4]